MPWIDCPRRNGAPRYVLVAFNCRADGGAKYDPTGGHSGLTGYAVVVFLKARRGEMSWRRAIGTMIAIGTPAVVAILGLLVYEARNAAASGVRGDPTYLHEFRADDMPLPVQLLEGVRVRAERSRPTARARHEQVVRQAVHVAKRQYADLHSTLFHNGLGVVERSGAKAAIPCCLCCVLFGVVHRLPFGPGNALPVAALAGAGCVPMVFVWYQTRHRTQILTALVAGAPARGVRLQHPFHIAAGPAQRRVGGPSTRSPRS